MNVNNDIESYEHDFSTKETVNFHLKFLKHNHKDKDDFSYNIRRGFGKFKRKLIFLLIVLINMIINFDHGAIPAATTTLMNELNLDHVAIGMIGSLVFLGLTLGASSAGPLFNNYAPKYVVTLGILMATFFLYQFTYCTSQLGLAVCRIGCGFFQVFSLIYFPVWVDQFGIHDSRTIWLSFLQLGVPLGTMLGYCLEAFAIGVFHNVNKINNF